MKETLSITHTIETTDVDPKTIEEINNIEPGADTEVLSPSQQRLLEARNRVSALLDERDKRKAQEAALATYETPFTPDTPSPTAETPAGNPEQEADAEREKEKVGTLRKIGDKALRFMEKRGQGKTAKLLEAWGIIPVIGTRHQQRGLNFSAWVARKYVKAQEARRSRDERIGTGFLSAESQAELNESEPDDEDADTTETFTGSTPASPETHPSTTAEHRREEAEEDAEEAEERRAERREKRPLRERAAGMKQRLGRLRGRVGGSAMKFLKKAGALAGKLRRRSAK